MMADLREQALDAVNAWLKWVHGQTPGAVDELTTHHRVELQNRFETFAAARIAELAEREATIAELIEQRNQLQNESDFHVSMCPVLLASREATIARLREYAYHKGGCATLLRALATDADVGPEEPDCDCGLTALATPDPGRRWLEAVEQAKGALRRCGSHAPLCTAYKQIGRLGSRSGLLWSKGDESTCDCELGKSLAALEALR